MNASDTGQPITRAEIVTPGTIRTTDGRPVVPVSEHLTGILSTDGRPIEAMSVDLSDGQVAVPIDVITSGALKTDDGRPVMAASAYSALGVRGAFGGSGTPVIIAVLGGQSNMEGRNADDAADTFGTNIYQYGGNADVPATYQQLGLLTTLLDHYADGGKGVGTAQRRVGPGVNLLKKLEAANPTAKIVAVPTSRGSAAMASGATPPWASGATLGSGGTNYEFMIAQANAARAAALLLWPDAVFTVKIFLVQGEQDAFNGASYATYYAALTDWITNTRARITGAGSAEVVIGSMIPELWTPSAPSGYLAGAVPINQAHVMASLNIAGVKYAVGPLDPSSLNDNLHYQPGSAARIQGDRLGDALTDVTGPTMTSAATYSNAVSSVLALALTSNDQHATFQIDGGAGAANFEISDPYLTPTLRWTGNGTGPAVGAYVVVVRARDGSGNYGATQSVTVTVASEVSPVSFFTASERGAVWNPNDISTLFQDIAGTTPVTTAGQPVGKMLDLSPNANHWVAAADNTTRPTYQVDSDGKGYLSFDGTNDVLFAPVPFVTPTVDMRHSACIGMFGTAPASERDALGCYGATTTPFVEPFAFKSVGSVSYSLRNDASGGFSPASGTIAGILDGTNKRVVSAHYNGPSSTMRQRDAGQRPAGGGTGYTAPGGWSNTIGSAGLAYAVTRASLGARGFVAPSGFFAGRLYAGYVINRFVTDTEVKNGEDWTAARCLTGLLP